MKKYLSDFTKEEVLEFANRIPFDKLFEEVEKATGVKNANLRVKEIKEEYGMPKYIYYTSDNIAEQCGIMACTFKEVKIENFTSCITVKDEKLGYCTTVNFSYEHKDGGRNGLNILSAIYVDGEENFIIR